MKEQQKITTPIAKAWSIAPGIIKVLYNEEVLEPVDVYAHIEQMREEFGEGLWLLSDFATDEKNESGSSAGFEFWKNCGRRCGTVMMGNGLSKIIVNFFLKFSKPKITTRIFTDEEKAIEWLKEQVAKQNKV